MSNGKVRRALFIIPLLFVMFFYFIVSTQKQMRKIKKEAAGTMHNKGMMIKVLDTHGEDRWFGMGDFKTVSREVLLNNETKAPNAFHLTPFSSRTVEFEGQFIGDVKRGGSCNVDTLSYVPHGLTHLETSAHLLNPDAHPPTVKDIPPESLSGIALLLDLSYLGKEPGGKIPWDAVRPVLEKNTLPISLLAIKTHASILPQDYDFSSKDFLSLSPETAKGIHDYRLDGNRIDCLILDLPSIDPESDGGKLLAHRNFFGLPLTGMDAEDKEKRALVELAWFSDLQEGYYYVFISPPRFDTNAVTTGILLRPLLEAK